MSTTPACGTAGEIELRRSNDNLGQCNFTPGTAAVHSLAAVPTITETNTVRIANAGNT